ncbi:MAG TPA: aminoglycoside phosphotransferase family protein [Pyrinomonadaceae bacterium]|nr:aminoglycoside phosphotransferase family protein [Pyrinomonadaceae bacterium]
MERLRLNEISEARATEDAVREAAESVLGAEVHTVSPLPFGNINRVFKVESAARSCVVKVFTYAGWPEAGKLPWVESQLTLHGVPRARLLHYTRDDSLFPHGFSVSEFVEGENCKAAVREGRLTPSRYFELVGALLRRIHAIRPPRYGNVGDGAGTDEDFVGWLLACDLRDRMLEIGDGTRPAETLYPLIERAVEPVLRRYESRFRPALLHADATPKNALLDGAGRFLLIDWDEAIAGFWVKDYTNLTYWYSYIARQDDKRDGADEVANAFFRGYGEPGFDREELREIEHALHTTQAADILAYQYKFGDVGEFKRTREILLQLLDAPPARRSRT